MGRRLWKLLFLLLPAMVLSGCSQDGGDPVVIRHKPYEREWYRSTTVRRGTLTPELVFSLRMTGVNRIQYSVADNGLEIDRIAVSKGDRVKKGDLLVSFISRELQERLEEYREKAWQDRLLIQHYERLQRVDKTADYRQELRERRREQRVTQLYMEEIQKKLRSNKIHAKRDGTITNVSEKLRDGTFQAGTSLVTEVTGSGQYRTETDADVDLRKGEVVQATGGGTTGRLKVTKVKKKGLGRKIVMFKPVSGLDGISEETELTVRWKKNSQADCVYVEKKAVCSQDGRHFVRRMDEKGYFEAVEVSLGQEAGDYIVITEGLSGGERVVNQEG
ncbi:MAG: biotin/lipoyl-binding protein [Eubacterium sp.]|jgi:hypothetical protein|nr:biotin/lipoyl-binding protein [Eubacterium sp.]